MNPRRDISTRWFAWCVRNHWNPGDWHVGIHPAVKGWHPHYCRRLPCVVSVDRLPEALAYADRLARRVNRATRRLFSGEADT